MTTADRVRCDRCTLPPARGPLVSVRGGVAKDLVPDARKNVSTPPFLSYVLSFNHQATESVLYPETTTGERAVTDVVVYSASKARVSTDRIAGEIFHAYILLRS